MFKRKKSLKKVTLSELKMSDAQMEFRIQSIQKEIKEVDQQISDCLLKGKTILNDIEQQSLARTISRLVDQQRDLIQKLDAAETKRHALLRLINIKESESSLSGKQNDIIDNIDLKSVANAQEDFDVENEMSQRRAKQILQTLDGNQDYDRILAILKAESLDDESVTVAKAEIDDLTLGKNRNSDPNVESLLDYQMEK